MISSIQRDSMGMFRRVFCVLFVLGIVITLCSLLSCRVPGGGPVYLSRIEGPWLFSANNFPGRLEFHWTGNVWTGQIFFNNLGHWEQLTDIFFDPHTGQVQFRRLSAGQLYSGALSGNQIVGTFGYGAPGGFHWEAWRH